MPCKSLVLRAATSTDLALALADEVGLKHRRYLRHQPDRLQPMLVDERLTDSSWGRDANEDETSRQNTVHIRVATSDESWVYW
jgi:hypothetical protein